MSASELAELDATARERLRAVLAVRPRGLFSDVDGTLSAIAPTPSSAVLLPGVAPLLERLRQVFDVVAAVSGRSAEDARRLVGLAGITYIGNHGMERLDPEGDRSDGAGDAGRLRVLPEAEPYMTAVNAALDEIAATLTPRYPGLRIEYKGVTGSVHVRNTPDPEAAEEAVAHALSELAGPSGLRVTRGKRVVEVRPPVEVDKGVAIAEVIRERHLQSALYLGDDRTDIDAFRMLRRLSDEGVCLGVSVAVLQEEAPPELAAAADVTLSNIERVPALLRWLAEAAG